MLKQEENKLKVILLGDSGTGKTNIISRIMDREFDSDHQSTNSPQFEEYKHDNRFIINIWDTAGQEKFRNLTKIFLKNSDIVILVYDKTNQGSFDSIDFWYRKITDELKMDNIVIGLLGNKTDLYEDEQITEEQGIEKAQKYGADHLCVSAKKDPVPIKQFLRNQIDKFIKEKWDLKVQKEQNLKLDNTSISKPVKKKKGLCW